MMPNDDESIYQSSDDNCVNHDPRCGSYLGTFTCEDCWFEEHASHSSSMPEETCPFCKPLLQALDAAEQVLLTTARYILAGNAIDWTHSPDSLTRFALTRSMTMFPHLYGMLVRLHTDGIAEHVTREAIKERQVS